MRLVSLLSFPNTGLGTHLWPETLFRTVGVSAGGRGATTHRRLVTNPHPLTITLPLPVNVRELFENELRKRGFPFTIDPESGRYAVEISGNRMLVGLKNLERDVASGGDVGLIPRFLDAIVASSRLSAEGLSAERLYWCLEPNDY